VNKLQTGYYTYSEHNGINYVLNTIHVYNLRKDTMFVTPTVFYDSVIMYTFPETIITYFNENDELLLDL